MRSTFVHGARPAVFWAAAALVAAGSMGCVSTRRSDFYAMRNVRISSSPGDRSTIVRAEPADLLTRERRAMALRDR
jgi:hypothetical protein